MTENQYYVYTLAWPDGRVFYVGKGSGNRPRSHLYEARRGDCNCRKCRTIRSIWKLRKDVLITHVFETTDHSLAVEKEREFIKELGVKYHLANRTGNDHFKLLPKPKRDYEMTYQEFSSYLQQMDLSPKERKKLFDDWWRVRYDHVERSWRNARRQRWDDHAEALGREMEELKLLVGRVIQWQMRL